VIKYLQYLVLCLIWGTTFAAIKIGSASTPPMVGLALRYWFAVAILIISVLLTGRKIPLDRESLKMYWVVGFYNMGLSYLCTYWAMQFIPSSLSSILWATFPLFTGIFANFMVSAERLNFQRLFSILVATLGVVLILSDQALVFNRKVLFGCILVLLGVVLASYPTVYVKTKKHKYDSIVLTTMSLIIGAVIHTFGALIAGEFGLMSWSFRNIGAAAYLGIFGSAVTFYIYYSLMHQMEVVKLSFVSFITPIIATLVGVIFLHEAVAFLEIFGIGLIFAGLSLYDFRKYAAYVKQCKTQN